VTVIQASQANGASAGAPATLDLEPLTADERAIVGVLAQMRATGNSAPLRDWAREGGEALERVREALRVLGELDLQLLVAVALDGLLGVDVAGSPSAAASARGGRAVP
jgi:hypothetical protein